MSSLCDFKGESVSILDPEIGTGSLSVSLIENLIKHTRQVLDFLDNAKSNLHLNSKFY